MNSKSLLKTLATSACIIAFASLFTEVFYAHLEYAAAFGEHIAIGFDLVKFNPLGIMPLLAPLILFAILFSNLKKKLASVFLILLFWVNNFCFFVSSTVFLGKSIAGIKWIVSYEIGLWLYPILYWIATTLVFAYCLKKNAPQ